MCFRVLSVFSSFLVPNVYFLFSVFFFSSRRRHTRCLSDWSSDVCSSDLRASTAFQASERIEVREHRVERFVEVNPTDIVAELPLVERRGERPPGRIGRPREIGRASCRERVDDGGDEGLDEQTHTQTEHSM